MSYKVVSISPDSLLLGRRPSVTTSHTSGPRTERKIAVNDRWVSHFIFGKPEWHDFMSPVSYSYASELCYEPIENNKAPWDPHDAVIDIPSEPYLLLPLIYDVRAHAAYYDSKETAKVYSFRVYQNSHLSLETLAILQGRICYYFSNNACKISTFLLLNSPALKKQTKKIIFTHITCLDEVLALKGCLSLLKGSELFIQFSPTALQFICDKKQLPDIIAMWSENWRLSIVVDSSVVKETHLLIGSRITDRYIELSTVDKHRIDLAKQFIRLYSVKRKRSKEIIFDHLSDVDTIKKLSKDLFKDYSSKFSFFNFLEKLL